MGPSQRQHTTPGGGAPPPTGWHHRCQIQVSRRPTPPLATTTIRPVLGGSTIRGFAGVGLVALLASLGPGAGAATAPTPITADAALNAALEQFVMGPGGS